MRVYILEVLFRRMPVNIGFFPRGDFFGQLQGWTPSFFVSFMLDREALCVFQVNCLALGNPTYIRLAHRPQILIPISLSSRQLLLPQISCKSYEVSKRDHILLQILCRSRAIRWLQRSELTHAFVAVSDLDTPLLAFPPPFKTR